MPNVIQVILVGIAMLAAGWFAGANLSTQWFGELTTRQVESIATSTAEVAVKEVIKEVIKEVPVTKEKIVIQDISQAKINEYENTIATLKTQLNQTYREVGDINDAEGYIIRLYPHGGDQPEYLDKIAIYETSGSKNSGIAVKMLQQEYDAQTGFTTIASTTYSVDIDSFVKNLNITLEKTSSGKPKFYYKFYAVIDGVSKFLFSFPSK
ncbi:MAG: hypothetical protein Q7S83_01580 [bacterium]|nr:hypothetical protein [bacterium]